MYCRYGCILGMDVRYGCMDVHMLGMDMDIDRRYMLRCRRGEGGVGMDVWMHRHDGT